MSNTINELWDKCEEELVKKEEETSFIVKETTILLTPLKESLKRIREFLKNHQYNQELIVLEQKIGNLAQIVLLTKELEEVKLTCPNR